MSKIANTVYTSEDVILNNEERDITVTLRPLPIARLREFMKEWDKMSDLNANPDDIEDDEVFKVYVRCCAVALRKQLAKEVSEVYTDQKDFTQEYIDLLEDFLDLSTIIMILDVCGGVKLENPKLMEALEGILEPEGDGTN